MVFYEPNTLFNGARPTRLGDIGDPRAGMSFHDYYRCPAAGCPDPDPVIENALDHVGKTGDAVLMTEFGASDDVGKLNRITEQADLAMVGWQQWHYCICDDPTTSGINGSQAIVNDLNEPPAGTNLRTPTLNALVRPYPQAIAGRPIEWGFDVEDGRFTFRYEPTRGVRRVTRVAIPPRAFRSGYRAHALGAEVISTPGAARLRLRSCPGASSVTLTVNRGRDQISGRGCR